MGGSYLKPRGRNLFPMASGIRSPASCLCQKIVIGQVSWSGDRPNLARAKHTLKTIRLIAMGNPHIGATIQPAWVISAPHMRERPNSSTDLFPIKFPGNPRIETVVPAQNWAGKAVRSNVILRFKVCSSAFLEGASSFSSTSLDKGIDLVLSQTLCAVFVKSLCGAIKAQVLFENLGTLFYPFFSSFCSYEFNFNYGNSGVA